MNLGREWKLGKPKKGHVYISRTLARTLDAEEGDEIILSIDMNRLIGEVWTHYVRDEAIHHYQVVPKEA